MQLPKNFSVFSQRGSGELSIYSTGMKISVFTVRAGNADPTMFTTECLLGGSSWQIYHDKNSEVLYLHAYKGTFEHLAVISSHYNT